LLADFVNVGTSITLNIDEISPSKDWHGYQAIELTPIQIQYISLTELGEVRAVSEV
jgi:hypothetical protein